MRTFRPTKWGKKKNGITFKHEKHFTPKFSRAEVISLLLRKGYQADRLRAMPEKSLRNLLGMYAGVGSGNHGLKPMGRLPIDRHLHKMGM